MGKSGRFFWVNPVDEIQLVYLAVEPNLVHEHMEGFFAEITDLMEPLTNSV